jgi:hypothetical protein
MTTRFGCRNYVTQFGSRAQEPNLAGHLRPRMAQHGLRPRDLEPLLGGRRRVSEVLNRKRPLTLAMIRRLHRELGIPAAVLVKEPPIAMPLRSRKKHSPSRPRRNRKLS